MELGLAFTPLSAGLALDACLANVGDVGAAEWALAATGADNEFDTRYLPCTRFKKRRRCAIMPPAQKPSNLATVCGGVLQALDTRRRDVCVADTEGFDALTQEPKFNLYTEQSRLTDFSLAPDSNKAITKVGLTTVFTEHILFHTAGITAVTRCALG
jgi:hypothetical protein